MPNTSNSVTVRLGELDHDPVALAGHEARLTQLDDLLASVPVKGQLQSLAIRSAGDGAAPRVRYWVKAGNRRLATLRRLRDTGGSILGVPVDDDYPVHCVRREETDAEAYETSRSENLQRVPETPVEEFRAFAKMAQTKTPAEIASVFGISEKRVNQRLKLAALHPDVLAALEEGKIKMDAAEAFTLAEPAQQAQHLNSSSGWKLDAYYIRQRFTEKLINGKSAAARLVGVEAYRAAGGRVLGDDFADDSSYWLDRDILEKLLEAHWEKQVAAWKAEGWSFVESVGEYCGPQTWKVSQAERITPAKPKGKKQGAEFAGSFTAEQMAEAGVVYYPDGSSAPVIGVKRWTSRGAAAARQEADLFDPPYEAEAYLEAVGAQAIGERVGADPQLALRMLIAALRRTGWRAEQSPLGVRAEFSPDATGEDEDLPDLGFSDALAQTEGMSLDGLLGELCRIVRKGFDAPGPETSELFLELVKPVPRFDARAFFETTDRDFIMLAWADMTDPAAGEAPLKGKAEDILAKAAQRAADTGWLPPQLRYPGYAGPCFATRREENTSEGVDEEDSDDFNEDESHLEAAE
jgi:ParB/RepB/Spo0J family partition protein